MSNAIALQTSTMDLIPDSNEWGTIHNMAKALLPTGFLPEGIKTPEQAVAIILKGRELRIPPMYALSNIHVIKGKPTVSAEIMLALVQRDLGMNFMWVEESTNHHCTVGYKSGNGNKFYTFSIDDAKTAGLMKSSTWMSYPAAMLRARAISATARMAAPGVIAGMYVPGELGDDVEMNDEGHIVSAAPYETTVTVEQPAPARERQETTMTIDDDGVIEDVPDAWQEAHDRFTKMLADNEVTDDESRALIRKWGLVSGKAGDMNIEQLRAACAFVEKKGVAIKAYAESALASEVELDYINQVLEEGE